MMITAQNKMGGARTVSQNYSGYMLQTTAFRLEDHAWLQSNLDAARQLLADIGDPNHPNRLLQNPCGPTFHGGRSMSSSLATGSIRVVHMNWRDPPVPSGTGTS
jgi:hypothetical protein